MAVGEPGVFGGVLLRGAKQREGAVEAVVGRLALDADLGVAPFDGCEHGVVHVELVLRVEDARRAGVGREARMQVVDGADEGLALGGRVVVVQPVLHAGAGGARHVEPGDQPQRVVQAQARGAVEAVAAVGEVAVAREAAVEVRAREVAGQHVGL